MAIETQQPDGLVFALTNLSGAAADIDEGVDSPDGVWLTLGDDAADSIVRASFPTPTGNPTAGAGLQKFRLYVRVGTEAGGNTPTMDVAVRETGGGSNLAAQTGISVTSYTGEVIEFTWDASVLAVTDGSAVEIYVIGQRSGGGPSSRRCVEFDAIEWVVDYSVSGTTYDETGLSIAVASTVTGNEGLAFTETGLNVAIVLSATGTDVALLADSLTITVVSAISESDVASFSEIGLTIAATSTVTGTDIHNVAGIDYDETGLAINVASTVIGTDAASFVESLTFAVASTVFGSDIASPVQADTSALTWATRVSRKIIRTSNGTLWVIIPQDINAVPRLRYSTDDGVNWSTSSTAFPVAAYAYYLSWRFCSDGFIYMVYQNGANSETFVRRGTLNGGHTDITWSAATTIKVLPNLRSDIAVHEEDGDTIVHIIYNTSGTLCEYKRFVWGSSSGSATTLGTWNGENLPLIDFHHTQDDTTAVKDSTPHVYLAWFEDGQIMFKKNVYSGGSWAFNATRVITSDAKSADSFQVVFDGTSHVVVCESLGTADALLTLERDAADTTTTSLANTPTRNGTGTAMVGVTYAPNRDIELFHSDNTTQVMQRCTYDRSGSSWGTWATIGIDADDRFPNVKIGYWSGSKDDAVEVIWTDQSGPSYPIMFERFTFAAAYIESLAVDIAATVTGTDALSSVESNTISIVSAIQGSDVVTFLESRSVTIAATIALSDNLVFTEALTVNITSGFSSTDIASFVDSTTVTIIATVSGSDAVIVTEALAIDIVATVTGTDLLSLIAYDETGGIIAVVSTMVGVDILTAVDSLTVAITSTVNGSDAWWSSAVDSGTGLGEAEDHDQLGGSTILSKTGKASSQNLLGRAG